MDTKEMERAKFIEIARGIRAGEHRLVVGDRRVEVAVLKSD
jgi:hypothetical protein